MNPRTDVNQDSTNHAADNGAVATEPQRPATGSAPHTSEAVHATGPTDRGTRRESVDPMRLTDRYRLVHPMTADF